MPGNALLLGFIATLLPGARIILCRRDPRDVALSIFQLRFFGHHPYAHNPADLGWYIGQHERLMRHWQQVLPLPVLEVALSDWVEDFHATLARVLAFLDLPHDPACERFYEQDRTVRTASAWQVRQPINARGIGALARLRRRTGTCDRRASGRRVGGRRDERRSPPIPLPDPTIVQPSPPSPPAPARSASVHPDRAVGSHCNYGESTPTACHANP